jgi:carboxyl-terminal processing protease
MDQYQKELKVFDSVNKKPRRRKIIKIIILTLVIIVCLGLTFWGGVYFGLKSSTICADCFGEKLPNQYGKVTNQQGEIPNYLRRDVDFNIFWDAWKILKEKYVEKDVPDVNLFYGTMSGLVAGLGDPYTNFFNPDDNKKFNQELAGNFEGIGAEIAVKKGQLLVTKPLPATPAEKAGLKSGDQILSIDGQSTQGMTTNEAVYKIRGPQGSQVTLEIFREGFDKPQNFYIIRDKIDVKSVTWTMKNNFAYIELVHFNGDTISEFNNIIQEILVKNPQGIILDLRDNPGGYLDMAVEVASEWVEDGPIVIETGREGKIDEFSAQGTARLAKFKTVVLINGLSASASEIVAGALQDYGLATIIGEKTFGKGSVQDIQQLKDGSAIKITVAKWLTPKGRSINEQGIKPDIEVKLTPEDFDNNRDPQLDKAVELLGGGN